MVVHHDPAHPAQHVTPARADAVVSQRCRGRDMQPPQAFDDAKPGFVEMLDRGVEDQLAHRIGKAQQTLPCPAAHLPDGRAREAHAEQVLHQRRQTILGHELECREIDHYRGNPLAILHWRTDPVGMLAGRHLAAGRAAATIRPMFSHHERRRFRKIEYLACDIAVTSALRQRIATVVAVCGEVIDDMVGIGHHGERFPGMVRLAADGFLRRLPQAAGARRRLFQARHSTEVCCCWNCSARGGVPTPPPVPQALLSRWQEAHSAQRDARHASAGPQWLMGRRPRSTIALGQAETTRPVSQAPLDSDTAVTCQGLF